MLPAVGWEELLRQLMRGSFSLGCHLPPQGDGEPGGRRLTSPCSGRLLRGASPGQPVLCSPGFSSSLGDKHQIPATFPFLLLCLCSELLFQFHSCLRHKGSGVAHWGDSESVCCGDRQAVPLPPLMPRPVLHPQPGNLSLGSQVLHQLLSREEGS